MRRHMVRLAAASLVALALFGAPARAQTDPSISIFSRLRDTSATSARAGATVRVVVAIRNNSLMPVTVTPLLALPVGWGAVSGASPFDIPELESREWSVALRVPAAIDTGRYRLLLSASTTGGKSINQTVDVQILAPIPAPVPVIATKRGSATTKSVAAAVETVPASTRLAAAAAPLAAPATIIPGDAAVATPAPVLAPAPAAPTRRTAVAATREAVVDAGATITRSVRVANRSTASEHLTGIVSAPEGWSVPMGQQTFDVGAGETEQWMVSIRVPARAPAGQYPILVSTRNASGASVVRDTILVTVNTRRALDVAMTNRSSYVVAGEKYAATFLLQNRGNVRTTVALTGTSSLGGAVSLDSTRITLEPASSRTVSASVHAQLNGQASHDDVMELRAVDVADSSVHAVASAAVTVVQRANTAEPLHRVATQLRLRAADASVGVSPFDFIGGGALRDGGSEQLAFVFRGPAGPASPFGDQDEYRVELRGAHYTARAGDALYKASTLTSNGQMGFGGGLDFASGSFSAGAFSQRFRTQPGGASEQAVYAGVRGDSVFAQPQVRVAGVSRTGGPLAGKIVSATASAHPIGGTTVELEAANSTGPFGAGSAHNARVSGGDRVHFDAGRTEADEAFAGAGRGARHDYASVSARATEDIQVSATTGAHRAKGTLIGQSVSQQTTATSMEVAYQSRFTLQYSTLDRTSTLGALPWHETQRGLLARAEQGFGSSRLWGSFGAGTAVSAVAESHAYRELTLGGSTFIGQNSFSFYGETSDGMSVTRGADRLLTLGGDARVQLNPVTAFSINGFSSRTLGGVDRYLQMDAALSRQLPSAGTVSLRMRLTDNALVNTQPKHLVFVEYATPLQMPIGRTTAAGRVRGEVVDRETGRGVAGMLVRLGPQAAITDAEGRVAFAGLPAGEHRLVIAQRTSATAMVFTGDPVVRVDSERHAPVTFRVAIERAGRVSGGVRRMTTVRTGIGAEADSVSDAGPLDAIDIALVGARDTLYASSSVAGQFIFAEVPSGRWMLKVLTPPQPGMYWAPAELEVIVEAGGAREVIVRQVPRRRAVQMIDGDAVKVMP